MLKEMPDEQSNGLLDTALDIFTPSMPTSVKYYSSRCDQ